MKYFLSLILSVALINAFGQDVDTVSNRRVLYVVDSVPILLRYKILDSLKRAEIDHVQEVTDQNQIKAAGYDSVNKVIYIITKAYTKRSDDIKKIPTPYNIKLLNGRYCLKNSDIPYTGPYRMYRLNGLLLTTGYYKNGINDSTYTGYYLNGNRSYTTNYIYGKVYGNAEEYYTNGALKAKTFYSGGYRQGLSEEYFVSGSLKNRTQYKDGYQDGINTEYYSTGEIKSQVTFANGEENISNQRKDFLYYMDQGERYLHDNVFYNALIKFKRAEKKNNRSAEVYFYEGIIATEELEFDKAFACFNKALEIEPLFKEALAYRALIMIRIYEFRGGHTLPKYSGLMVSKVYGKALIPSNEQLKICSDLNKSVELGDDNEIILDALKKYCHQQ